MENVEIICISLPQKILRSRKNKKEKKKNAAEFADKYPRYIPIPNSMHACRVLSKPYTHYSRVLREQLHMHCFGPIKLLEQNSFQSSDVD